MTEFLTELLKGQLAEPLNLSTLNCVYFVLLIVGVVYAVVILVAGEIGDVGGDLDLSGGHGVSFDHGTVDVPSLSPVTIASFVTSFGAFGLIATGLFGASSALSLLWATVGALIVAIIAHFAFGYFLIAPQSSSEVTASYVVGATGEVITPIAEGRLGEVAFVARGGRVTTSARAADRMTIPRGTIVRIEQVVGNVAIVRPVENNE
jgi:membrane protein implicated in regulation of membrane protease activity